MISNINKKKYAKYAKNDIVHLFKLINEKKIFLIFIFLHLLIQHYITYYVGYKITIENTKEEDPNKYYAIIIISAYIIGFILGLILIFVVMPVWIKFILFSLFSALCGIIFISIKNFFDPNIIHGAVIGSIIVFAFMIVFGVALTISGIQYTNKVAFGLFYALLVLIIINVVQYFTYYYSIIIKLLLFVAAFLFSLYIVNTSNNVLQRDYEGDFISASFDYYIDNSNFFNALAINDR